MKTSPPICRAHRRSMLVSSAVVVVFSLLFAMCACESPYDATPGGPFPSMRREHPHSLVFEEAEGAFNAESISWWQCLKNAFHSGSVDDTQADSDSDSDGDASTSIDLEQALAYNETTAVYLAYVTSVAYCQAHHIRNWSCSPCALVQPLEEISVVEDRKDNFQGLVGYSKERNVVLVAFRGSMDISNWIDNITFVKKRAYPKFPDVKVHQGFYWVYETVASQVLAAVRALLDAHPTASVVVTGHSLGAAVAALTTFDLAVLQDIPVHAIYTFGEPRVGNANFTQLLNHAVPEVYRITHYRDAVPHLPPTWIGFHHSAQEIYYDEYASTYTACNPLDGEDPLCSDACSPFGCTSIVDHLNYLNVTMSHLIC